jgi:hypothetical protein
MAERSWFWRKVGFWFVPVKSGKLGRDEWAKIQRMSRSGRSRRARRFTVLLWIGTLGFMALVACFGARLWAVAGLLYTASLLSIVLFGAYRIRIGLALPTMEDTAVMNYGAEFEALEEKQRGELVQQMIRDGIRGRVRLDEREAELRLQSEGEAYRLLRPVLVVAVGVYWTVCLLGPFAAAREMLAVSAVVFSWMAAAVLVLPTMVRMWTQPDEVGEPKVVMQGRVG